MKKLFFLTAVVLLQQVASAQPKLSDMYDDKDHFAGLYADADMKYTFDKWQSADFAIWQQEFGCALRERLGLARIESSLEGYKPEAKLMKTETCEGFTREYYIIWTEPTVPLPFVVMKPSEIRPDTPLVLAIQGHSKNPLQFAGVYMGDKDREAGEKGERNIGVQAVREGYIAVIPTTRGFGDTRTAEDREGDKLSSCRTNLMHDLLVGRTPIGDRVWDMMKIIDWSINSLPIDKNRIIVTGNSGGGTIALFTGAMDKRVAVTMPGSYFCTFVGSIGTLFHCDCNYIPGILNLGEMYDIAGLIAPRYFRAIHGQKDNIFPVSETLKAFEKTKAIYTAAGVPDNCTMYVGPEGHRYYKAGAWNYIRETLN